MSAAAHDVVRTYDCVFPGCPREARSDGGWCDEGHIGSRPTVVEVGGRVVPGSLAHLMEDDEPAATQPTPTPDPDPTPEDDVYPFEGAAHRCKVEGCDNERLDRAGPYGGLCETHKNEAKLEKAARRAAAQPADPVPPVPPVPPLEPIAAVPPPVSEKQAPLTALAAAVDQASAEIAEARARHTAAVEALRAALDHAA